MICAELNKAIEKEIMINKQLRRLQEFHELLEREDIGALREKLIAIEKYLTDKKSKLIK